ncbi:hypothetical protein AAF712_008789 [Marasmius tenuissimus]|uniref:Cytochrome P450 n=1 Tax=Marasmius tenuissimus TaxID=585030 RepID=A0ABR2ZSG1_9AGAR
MMIDWPPFTTASRLSLVAKVTFTATVGWVAQIVIRRAIHYFHLKHIAGPSFGSLFNGNFQETFNDRKATVINQWINRYGKVFRTWAFFGQGTFLHATGFVPSWLCYCLQDIELYVADLKGIGHILKHDSVRYQKPELVLFITRRLIGNGLFVIEGDAHRKQRKVMNPAFGPAEIRNLTGIFLEKSVELRDAWTAQIQKGDGTKAEVDVLHWLSRMTLDVIGQAGFNYQFNAISGQHNPLNEAFSKVFSSGNFMTPSVILKLMFPPLRVMPETDGAFRRAKSTCFRIAGELFEQSKAAAMKVSASQDKDLFTLLIGSNMKTEVPEDQRMTDAEVLAQVPTFLAAGHETTSTSTTWAFYLLCAYPEVQRKLREEVSLMETGSPSMDRLNALPYLDAVVRETLRLLAPVTFTLRQAMEDDVIPLGAPFVDRYGRRHESLEVKKGQSVIIPILAINKDKSLWGEDAEEFRPERWENLPEAVKSVPGIWGNMMTFLGGPHACIGWRFTIVETKALLFTLLRAFEFELTVPKEDIFVKRGIAIIRPQLRGKEASRLALVAKVTITAAVGWVVQIVIRRTIHYFRLKHIAGPSFASLFSGNFQETFDDCKAAVINQWIDRYGKVFRTWAFFGDIEIYVADLKGISHILKHDSLRYQKPELVLFTMRRLVGDGLFVIEGDAHRKQRKVMNPAFGPAEIRNLTGTFLEKSVELRDAWTSQIQKGDGSKAEVDVLHWLSRMTLDVIGQAGFNYQFNAVSGKYNPLNEAFSKVFSSGNFMTPSVILKLMFPPLRALPETDAAFRRAKSTCFRIAGELFEQSKAAAMKVSASTQDKDLFTLLIGSNMKTEVPEDQRMTDAEVLARELWHSFAYLCHTD